MILVLQAAGWGLVGGLALVLGAAVARWLPIGHRVIGLIMGFGAGVLISAVTFELVLAGTESAGLGPVLGGLAAGSLVFFAGDWWLDRRGAEGRKNPQGMQQGAAGSALVLGALLDGVPESAAIGVSVLEGGSVGVAVLAAVFLSNLPEGIAATSGLCASGRSDRFVFGLWGAVALACAVSAAAGALVLGGAGPAPVAATQAFAAGAILTMVADTMLPEAVRYAGPWVGLVTVTGFGVAVLLSLG